MLVQSDYHIHASFYRIKEPDAVIGPAAAEQLSAARNAGRCFVGIVEHCNASPKHLFHCLEELSEEYYGPDPLLVFSLQCRSRRVSDGCFRLRSPWAFTAWRSGLGTIRIAWIYWIFPLSQRRRLIQAGKVFHAGRGSTRILPF